MSLSVMQLDSCVVRRLVVECQDAGEDREDESGTVDYRMTFSTERHPTLPWFRVRTDFEMRWPDDAPSPFRNVVVGLTGEFRFAEDAPPELIEKFVPEVCLANLYAMARGVVAQATGMFPGGPLLLPLLNIHQMIKDASAEASTEAVKADAPSNEAAEVTAADARSVKGTKRRSVRPRRKEESG